MFVSDPFDVAPAAQRPTRAAWLVLAAGVAFALVCAALLQRSFASMQHARAAVNAQEEAHRAMARQEAADRERARDPAFVAKLRAQQEVQRALRMSWSGLFDALEHAARNVDGRVSITSLRPIEASADAAQVNVAGFALTSDSLLDYVEALERQPQVRSAVLTAQEPTDGAGTRVLRFHLTLAWQPR